MQQQDAPKGACTLRMPNIPPLEENQQSAPLILTLITIMTSNTMEPPMSTPCEASTPIAKTPIEVKRKNLIEISPIPQRNMTHCEFNMMSQGEASNPQIYQSKDPNIMLTSKGHNQLRRQ